MVGISFVDFPAWCHALDATVDYYGDNPDATGPDTAGALSLVVVGAFALAGLVAG